MTCHSRSCDDNPVECEPFAPGYARHEEVRMRRIRPISRPRVVEAWVRQGLFLDILEKLLTFVVAQKLSGKEGSAAN